MIKIRVWYKEDTGYCNVELSNLKPRRYMCGWDFNRCIKYIKEELYWMDIDVNKVEVITFVNLKEHWEQNIVRGE